MTNETYNGWSNKATWLVKLWIDNEQESYNDIINLVTRNKSLQPYHIGDKISGYVDKMLPELPASLASDLLNYALAWVNWTEIAESYLSDIQ